MKIVSSNLRFHIKTVALVCLLIISNLTALATPFAEGRLDPEILDQFIPLILDEIDKEFAHQNDGRTCRDTREYGYSFFKMENDDFTYTSPPKFYQELGSYICQALGHQPVEFTNIILSRYEEGFHLEPHIDIHSSETYGYNFYFDENVYGIVIEADPTGHLYFINNDTDTIPSLNQEPVYSLKEFPGTIFLLQGPYRKFPYFHGVTNVSNRRITITFRTVQITSSSSRTCLL